MLQQSLYTNMFSSCGGTHDDTRWAHFCKSSGYEPCEIESELKTVSILNGNNTLNMEEGFIVDDIRRLNACSNFSFSFIKRKGNYVAHALATVGFNSPITQTWVVETLLIVFKLIQWLILPMLNNTSLFLKKINQNTRFFFSSLFHV